MWILDVVPAGAAPFSRRLAEESLVVGRAANADLACDDRYMSRLHARFFRRDGELWAEDLGSQNGTRVNGRRIEEPVRLAPGDVVEVSTLRLTVRDDAVPEGHTAFFRPADELLADTGTEAGTAAGPPPPPEDADALRRYAERLRLLTGIHRALARPMDLPALLELLLERAFDHLEPEEGAIFLWRDDGALERVATRGTSGAGPGDFFSTSLEREVAEEGQAALVLDARTDERFADADSIQVAGVRSLVAAPLLDARGSLGMIVLASRLGIKRFTEEDMELLTAIASAAALRIRNVALAAEALERRRLEEELALARSIQVALLPQTLPAPPGWEIHAHNDPSRGVSGDYYALVERRREQALELVLMLVDVSGKGLGAAFLTAALEALAAGPIEEGVPPGPLCEKVSGRFLQRTLPAQYATAFVGALDPATGELTVASAGHPPAFVARAAGDVDWLASTGPPLGLLPGGTFGERSVRLAPGDLLVVYSDGITESPAADGEEYGPERLAVFCGERRALPLGELSRDLGDELRGWAREQARSDDRTLLLLRRQP